MTLKRIAILFSGHLRNINQHILNLKNNFLNILSDNGYSYDIFIHTWDNNVSNDVFMNNDAFYEQKCIKSNSYNYSREITIFVCYLTYKYIQTMSFNN